MATVEFVELAKSRLAPGGTIVVNVIGALTGDASKLLRSLVRTYRAVFPTVVLHPVYLDRNDRVADEPRNVILVATEAAAPARSRLQKRWDEIRAGAPEAPDLETAIRDRWERTVAVADVPLLTDAYAPTDALLLP
jgi:hypothetical protein